MQSVHSEKDANAVKANEEAGPVSTFSAEKSFMLQTETQKSGFQSFTVFLLPQEMPTAYRPTAGSPFKRHADSAAFVVLW